jgi:hypothetical protein
MAPRPPRYTCRQAHLASRVLYAVVALVHRIETPTMDAPEFYNEQKWCEQCKRYVRFLMSVNHSFCVDCGSRVRLFSRDDNQRVQEHVQRHKWQAS